MAVKWIELTPPERSRTYTFPAKTLTFADVRRIAISESGHHRLELGDGRKFIVAPTWLTIELDMDNWTF